MLQLEKVLDSAPSVKVQVADVRGRGNEENRNILDENGRHDCFERHLEKVCLLLINLENVLLGRGVDCSDRVEVGGHSEELEAHTIGELGEELLTPAPVVVLVRAQHLNWCLSLCSVNS